MTGFSRAETLSDDRLHAFGGNPVLLQRVAIAYCHRSILHRLTIHGDAEWRADFVLAAIASADCARLVVEHWERLAQILRQLLGKLGHAVFLHQRKHAGLDRSERGREAEHRAAFGFALD